MMRGHFLSLLKKDFRLMLSSKFFLLALGSLILYSCYINLVYVKLDQEMFSVYRYAPERVQEEGEHLQRIQEEQSGVIDVGSQEELVRVCEDGYSVGLIISGESLSDRVSRIKMVSSGVEEIDRIREAYAASKLFGESSGKAEVIGENNKEMKSRREISAEFLFFELAAVGFLGLAAMLFKEKQMGVIRVHAIMPLSQIGFVLSKLVLILLSDLLFAALLTVINLGIQEGFKVLPTVLLQAGILSLIMALAGFLCAVALPDFKQFSLVYLVLAVFITTPVFLAGQTGMEMNWIGYHPMYHLFMEMKNAYFQTPAAGLRYYVTCAAAIILLFLLAMWGLRQEMKKEG